MNSSYDREMRSQLFENLINVDHNPILCGCRLGVTLISPQKTMRSVCSLVPVKVSVVAARVQNVFLLYKEKTQTTSLFHS